MADNQPLKVGDPAPDFELMNQDKNKVKLSDYRGKKKVMLLFYPMDFSPICTQEHCTFGPAFDKLNGPDADTVVFGVSCDSPFCHAAFRKQYNIPYDLLADVTRKMSKAYGMFGVRSPTTARSAARSSWAGTAAWPSTRKWRCAIRAAWRSWRRRR